MKKLWKRNMVAGAVLLLVCGAIFLNGRYAQQVEETDKILGQATHISARFNVARQQGQERGNGRVLVLGIGAGHDDFTATQLERELAAGIGAKRLPD